MSGLLQRLKSRKSRPHEQTLTFSDSDALMAVVILINRMGGHVRITQEEIEDLRSDTKVVTRDNYLSGGIDIWVK